MRQYDAIILKRVCLLIFISENFLLKHENFILSVGWLFGWLFTGVFFL